MSRSTGAWTLNIEDKLFENGARDINVKKTIVVFIAKSKLGRVGRPWAGGSESVKQRQS